MQETYRNQLNQMGIFPISEVMFANKQPPASNLSWLLFDVYKVAANFPLEISVYAKIFNDYEDLDNQWLNNKNWLIEIADKFRNKSTRLDLKGLALDCGLVVSNL